MSHSWKYVEPSEASKQIQLGTYVEYKVNKAFRNIKALWNPVPDNHAPSSNNSYRILVKDE